MVDGAHNPASARELKQSVEHYFKGQASCKEGDGSFNHAILVIGASCDKDIAGVVSELYPIFDRVIVTHSRHPRAMATEIIVAEFRKHGVEARSVETVPEALSLALAMVGERDFICVTGSLFVVGEVIEQIGIDG